MTTRTEKPKIKYAPKSEKDKKRAEDWDKSTLGKIGRFIGKASAPMSDADETIRWIMSRGKLKTGGPLGYTRKSLRDLGMGQSTKDKIKKNSEPKTEIIPPQVIERAIERRKEPVGGVAIRRKPVSRTNRRAVRDF